MTDLHTRIAELAAKATPGAWSHYTEHEQTGFRMVRTYIQGYDGEHLASRMDPDDAALIVTLRNAIPEILAALCIAERVMDEDWLWGTIDDGEGGHRTASETARAIIAALKGT